MNTQTCTTQDIVTSVVGVTYDGRQAVVLKLVMGEEVFLLRDPLNPYDRNAIKVTNQHGQQLGFIARDLASGLAAGFDRYGKPVSARVTYLSGGCHGYSAGVQIRFQVPSA
jgi:single-stranded-DNA-specific exonuclease